MIYMNYIGRGRPLRIAIGITILMLVLAGGVGATQFFNISGTKYNGSGISLGTMLMTTGQTWSLGTGYELTVNAVDPGASPRQVWFTLKKNGALINDSVVVEGQTYNYNNLFFTKIKRIFFGAKSDMVQLTDTFLLEKAAEPFSGWKIYLKNATTGIEISNTTTGVSGSYTFIGLSPGVYNVSEERREGWVAVTPLSQIVTISTSNIANLNFTNANLIMPIPIPTPTPRPTPIYSSHYTNSDSNSNTCGNVTTNLTVFVRGLDNSVCTQNWNGRVWSGWQSLGGYVTSDISATSSGSNITIFVRGGDNAIYTQTWNGSAWSGWQGLGSSTTGKPEVTNG